MQVTDKMVEAERDHYKNGLQMLASTFYKEDQHQDYAKHILDTAPRAALAHREAEAVTVDRWIDGGANADYQAARSALVAPPAQEAAPVRYLYDFIDVTTGAVVEEVSKVDRTGEPRVSNVRPLYATPPAVPEGMVLVPVEILDRFPEINPSNYDHDDACALNAWGIELLTAAQEGR